MQAAPEEVRRPEPVKSVEAGLLGSREAPPACTDRHTSAWAAAPGAGHAREAGAAADKAAGGSDLKLSLPAGTGAGWGRAQPEAVPPSGPCGGQQQQPASAGPGAAGTGATFDCSLADAHQAQQQQQDDGAQQCSDGAALQAGGSQGSAAIPDASSSASSAASTARSQGSGSSHSGPGSNDDLQLSSEVKHLLPMHVHAACCSVLWLSFCTPSMCRAPSVFMMPLQDYAALLQRFRQVYTGPAKEDVTPEELADDMMRCQYNAAVDALQARWANIWSPICLWLWTAACTQPVNALKGRSGKALRVGILPCTKP